MPRVQLLSLIRRRGGLNCDTLGCLGREPTGEDGGSFSGSAGWATGSKKGSGNMIRISKLCLASLAVIASTTSAPQTVFAQTLELQIGPDGVKPRFVDPDEEDQSSRRARGKCDLDEATDIAREEGLRRPRIVDVTERRVVVRGRTYDGSETMVFANRRGCPVIG